MINWLSHRAGKGFVEGAIDAVREWFNKVLKVRPRQVNDPTLPIYTGDIFPEYTTGNKDVKEQAHDVLKGRR